MLLTQGEASWLLSPVQAHKRRPGPLLFFSFLFRWCHPSAHAAALLCCWAAVAWKETQSSPIKIKRRLTKPWTGSSRTGQLLCQRTNPWPVMPHACQSSCGRVFYFVPLAHVCPSLPFKADSIAWNEICLLLYDCTSTAEMPARLQTAARRGRDTPQPLLSLCPPSHRVLATGEKTSSVSKQGEQETNKKQGNKSRDTAAQSDPTWRPAKVIRAAKSDSLACLAATVAVMIYWSHCGKKFLYHSETSSDTQHGTKCSGGHSSAQTTGSLIPKYWWVHASSWLKEKKKCG